MLNVEQLLKEIANLQTAKEDLYHGPAKTGYLEAFDQITNLIAKLNNEPVQSKTIKELDNLVKVLGEAGGFNQQFTNFQNYQGCELNEYDWLNLKADAASLFRSSANKRVKQAAAALMIVL